MKKGVEQQLDKNTLLIILYFIEKLNGVLGKTHLQKMLFLSDLISTKKYKEKLTTIDYQKYHFGPYSEAVADYVKELKSRNLIEERELPFHDESGKTYTRYYFKSAEPAKPSLLSALGADKTILLDDIANSFGNMSLQEVLDVVYSLETVKDAEKGTPLDMAKFLDDEREENFPDILAGL